MNTYYTQRIESIEASLKTLYGRSETCESLLRRSSIAKSDIKEILNNRGLRSPIIAVLGHKNAGKSTLCSLLVKSPTEAAKIRAGIGANNATLKALWIGSKVPQELDYATEESLSIPSSSMYDLGTEFSIVDIPGYSDADAGARNASVRALRMASTILFVSSIERLEDESALHYIRLCEGAHIQPVIVDDKFAHREPTTIESDCIRFQQRIQGACPASTVESPIRIPRINDSAEAETIARDLVIDALKALLEDPKSSPEQLAQTRFEQWVRELSAQLSDLLEHVEPHYLHLINKEEEITLEVANQLIGSNKQIYSSVRARMLAIVTKNCPTLFFPYRSFLGLLSFTAGAWDKLIFSSFGSVPSLVMTYVQTRENIKSRKQPSDDLQTKLATRATEIATSALAEANTAFARSIVGKLPPESRNKFSHRHIATRVEGITELQNSISSLYESVLTEKSPAPRVSILTGLVALFLWIGLAAGPTYSIYKDFIEAWNNSIQAGQHAHWTEFPTPSFGMIFASVVLIFAPVFLIALITQGLTVSNKRINRCSLDILQGTKEEVKSAIDKRTLRLVTDDEVRNAVRTLLDTCYALKNKA
ncbi:GTPase [Rubritalea sp.]|uniref:GTPase n=1 Tax=Rubritalea sp. TaxID=2109375 RepID=UPI003EF456FD